MQGFLTTKQYTFLFSCSTKCATKWRAGSLGHAVLGNQYEISDGTEVLLLVTTSTQNMTFCSTPIQLVLGTFFLEKRGAERELD
jgi:hypothetical protein